jgi:hypothetical protein
VIETPSCSGTGAALVRLPALIGIVELVVTFVLKLLALSRDLSGALTIASTSVVSYISSVAR